MLPTAYALLILRLLIGLLFIGHGAQKLFGWFGGHGLDGTAAFFENLAVYPPKMWAIIAALSEAGGGLLLVLGFLTPVAAAAIIGVMLMAIIRVHWQNGLWLSNNGMEYTLTNIAVAAVLGWAGPGAYALDTLAGIDYPMPLTFVAALILVIIGVIAGLVSSALVSEPEARTQS